MPTDIGVDEAKVAAALAAAPPEETEQVEEVPADAAPVGSPTDPNAAEPAGATSTPKPEEGVGKDTAADPEASGAPKKPLPETVPYSRFQEVIQQKNELLAAQKAQEEAIARRGDELARVRASAMLEQIAQQHPEIAHVLRGEAAPAKEEALPEDPVQREIAMLRKENVESRKWREEQDRREMIRGIEDRVETAIEKHDVVKRWRGQSDTLREFVEGQIVHRILAKPQSDPEKVVDEVANALREVEESVKAQYKAAKVAPAKTVPPGVGAGAPQPPGQPHKALTLDKLGEFSRAVAAAMSQGE